MSLRRSIVLSLLLAAGAVAAADAPPAAAEATAPARPLERLPYTPGLDPAAMDRSVDPCTDFYAYSCGGWQKANPIPADQASWSVYGKLYQENQQFLWGILDGLARGGEGRSDNQRKMGDYFAACMDEAANERLGLAPLAPTLAAIEGLRSVRELPVLLARLQVELGGGGFFFSFDSNQDFADSQRVIAFADAGGLGLPERDDYTDADAHARTLRTQYLAHVGNVFGLLGEPKALAAAHARAVLRLETRLARASLKPVDRRDPQKLFHDLAPAQLQALTPRFDWPRYFEALGIGPQPVVNVTEPAFYRALDGVLGGVPLADLKAYLRWQAAKSASGYLTRAFDDERFAFEEHVLRGVPQKKPRWKRCVAEVDAYLGEALGQEFVARTFGPAQKEATQRMTRQVEAAMREDILALPWMSGATKAAAIAKLEAIANKVGYPDRWRDYSALAIVAGDRLGNALRATAFERRRSLAKIGKPLDRGEWGMTPQTVNAYYNAQMNDINFPAGVLQPPLYDPAMDDAPNYGNTGGTIGHELTHGFDDEGRQFDAQGNLKDWWQPADAAEFKQRAQCVVDQYAEYVVVDDIHVNSQLTLGEDLADLGGLILAHMAWRAQLEGQPEAGLRDGLTPEQRFFVGYAQWACSNERPENARLNARTDPHSPDRYRVNGLMPNLPDFARAFSCPAGAPMAKLKPCRVW